MWRRILAFAMTAGCGRLAFDAHPSPSPQGDSGTDGLGVGSDAPIDAVQWSVPQAFPELMVAGATTQDPSVTADRLEMYLSSGRTPACGGGADLWVTTRATPADPWSAPTCVTALSSSGYEASPEISEDGLTIYWSSSRLPTLGGRDIYTSTRATRTSPWSAPVRLDAVSTAGNEANVAVSGDGLTMVIDTDSGGNRDLYISTWSGTAWSTPAVIAATVTADSEGAPGLDHDGSHIYYTHGVEADQTSFDIFVTERAGTAYGSGVPVGPLNSTVQDGDPFLTPDGHMFFSSTRAGNVDVYEAVAR
jgi:Tol biopolymer transport system component